MKMRIPNALRLWLVRRLVAPRNHLIAGLFPDQIIGGRDNPYLHRWHVIPRNPIFNIYLHHFLRSDDDRALHDHPWVNASILLLGRYTEHTIAAGGIHTHTPFAECQVKFRLPRAAHRVELAPGETCWTLFITGPRVRSWGFHCERGWRHWRIFTSNDGSDIGRGCD